MEAATYWKREAYWRFCKTARQFGDGEIQKRLDLVLRKYPYMEYFQKVAAVLRGDQVATFQGNPQDILKLTYAPTVSVEIELSIFI